jgi:hypothetical protein
VTVAVAVLVVVVGVVTVCVTVVGVVTYAVLVSTDVTLDRDVDEMATLTVVSAVDVKVAAGSVTDCVVATAVMQAQAEE